jgi:hypothetical protein
MIHAICMQVHIYIDLVSACVLCDGNEKHLERKNRPSKVCYPWTVVYHHKRSRYVWETVQRGWALMRKKGRGKTEERLTALQDQTTGLLREGALMINQSAHTGDRDDKLVRSREMECKCMKSCFALPFPGHFYANITIYKWLLKLWRPHAARVIKDCLCSCECSMRCCIIEEGHLSWISAPKLTSNLTNYLWHLMNRDPLASWASALFGYSSSARG